MILCLTFGGQTTGVFAYTETAARGRLLRYADVNQTYGQRGAFELSVLMQNCRKYAGSRTLFSPRMRFCVRYKVIFS